MSKIISPGSLLFIVFINSQSLEICHNDCVKINPIPKYSETRVTSEIKIKFEYSLQSHPLRISSIPNNLLNMYAQSNKRFSNKRCVIRKRDLIKISVFNGRACILAVGERKEEALGAEEERGGDRIFMEKKQLAFTWSLCASDNRCFHRYRPIVRGRIRIDEKLFERRRGAINVAV